MSSRKQKLTTLFNNQKGRCYLCGGDMTLALGKPNTAEVEHVIPVWYLQSMKHKDYSLGGFNLAAAGHLCNLVKAGLPVTQVATKLVEMRLCDTADGREAQKLALVRAA